MESLIVAKLIFSRVKLSIYTGLLLNKLWCCLMGFNNIQWLSQNGPEERINQNEVFFYDEILQIINKVF